MKGISCLGLKIWLHTHMEEHHAADSSLFTDNTKFEMGTPVSVRSSDIVTIEDSKDRDTTNSLTALSSESENEDSVASISFSLLIQSFNKKSLLNF